MGPGVFGVASEMYTAAYLKIPCHDFTVFLSNDSITSFFVPDFSKFFENIFIFTEQLTHIIIMC